jgi:Family of unknown function (DUF5681)
MQDEEKENQEAAPAPAEKAAAPKVRGQFKPGQSGNPAGRPKTPKTRQDVIELAREKTGAAIEFLARTVQNTKAPFNARVQSAVELLNRGWGRPHQSLDINHGMQDPLAQLLDEINGRFQIKTIEGSTIGPALEAQQSLLDNGQERQPDSVPIELGPRKLDE